MDTTAYRMLFFDLAFAFLAIAALLTVSVSYSSLLPVSFAIFVGMRLTIDLFRSVRTAAPVKLKVK